MSMPRLVTCTAVLACLAAAPVLAQTMSDHPATSGSSSEPATKKPAKAGAQSGKASGPGVDAGQPVEGTGAGEPAAKKPAKAGAQSGRASAPR